MPVFGRRGPHRYEPALAEWIDSEDPEYCCLSLNVEHDDRVSVEREQVFDAFVAAGTPSGSDLVDALTNYFYERVQGSEIPDYFQAQLNELNFCRFRNLDVPLARILDLTGLDRILEWARSIGKSPFKSYPSKREKSFAWVLERIKDRDAHDFVGATLEVLAEYSRSVARHQPAWATTWASIRPDQVAGRWLEVVGMRNLSLPRLVILLKYRMREGGTLIRPTQLDAAANCRHFPSPAEFSESGHPMDLRTKPKSDALIPEFIHDQIAHSADDWTGLYGVVDEPDSGQLKRQRAIHWRLLEAEYPSLTECRNNKRTSRRSSVT
jgi:hypothetical protein